MSETNNRTVTLKRTFNAPIKLVWEAWTYYSMVGTKRNEYQSNRT